MRWARKRDGQLARGMLKYAGVGTSFDFPHTILTWLLYILPFPRRVSLSVPVIATSLSLIDFRSSREIVKTRFAKIIYSPKTFIKLGDELSFSFSPVRIFSICIT